MSIVERDVPNDTAHLPTVPNEGTPQTQASSPSAVSVALRRHWPEYLMEAAGLGIFMAAACSFAILLSHPNSPAVVWLSDAMLRRVLMGLAMGATAMGIVYSPWGKQSGAHLNPSVTLTFWRLGKVAKIDAVFYAAAQIAGGLLGVLCVSWIAGRLLADPAVNYAVTVPGPAGIRVAFVTELIISFMQMTMVLWINNSRLARWTGVFAGCMVAINISMVGPLSGMSMNPARTLASALPAHVWHGIWIYFTAPPLAMLMAAETYLRLRGAGRVRCAKLHHQNDNRCIFCDYQAVTGLQSNLDRD
jgi:aquaporin Z